MIYSLKRGISSLSDRMGADIIVVPEGYDSKVTGAILRGEPNSFFFDRAVEDRVKAVEGVEKTAPQLFLATLSASCCSFPIQIIGIDFNSDFTVAPWLEKQVGLPLKEGEIIVGNNVEGNIHAEVKFFSRPFKIKGRLAKTGMGFDNTVFMSIEQAKALAVEFEKTLQTPDAGRENMISSVMVRVKRGESPEEVLKRLRAEFKSDGIYPILSIPITITIIIHGIEDITSTKRINTVSIIPPKYPAAIPALTPINIEVNIASIPTKRDTRPPYKTLIK